MKCIDGVDVENELSDLERTLFLLVFEASGVAVVKE